MAGWSFAVRWNLHAPGGIVFEMDRRILPGVLALILVFSSSADARKWTDVAGNQISADYVRVHEAEVVLRQGSRVIRCPYDKFSDLDKAYIREQMEADRTKTKRRAGISQISGPVVEETEGDTRELRTWHDAQGRKILAQYAGFSLGRIELLKEGRRVSYPFTSFSLEDQIYVAQILTAEGRVDEIPKEKTEPKEEDSEGPSRGGNGRGEPGAMGGSFSPPEPDYEVASSPRGPNYGGPNLTGPNSSFPKHPSSPRPGHGSPVSTSPGGYKPDYETSPAAGSSLSHARPHYSSSGPLEEVGVCSNCGKTVPSHIGAGDRCPHCNVRFDYEEKADGSREYAGGSWRYNRAFVRLTVLGIFVVMGALGALFRR